MPYLIQHPSHPRPYFTVLEFLAQDFQRWRYNMSAYSDTLPYINDVRRREQHLSLVGSRPTLMEIWVRELYAREHDPPEFGAVGQRETRNQRISDLLRNFIQAVVHIGCSQPPKRVAWWTAERLKVKNTPLPDNPGQDLAVRYVRLLQIVQHCRNASLPPEESDSGILQADKLTLKLLPNDSLKREHCFQALDRVRSRPGQMALGPEISWSTGIVKLQMWVDVSDCVVSRESGCEDLAEPLPLYESGELPPAYED
jgi:hypothetical protein